MGFELKPLTRSLALIAAFALACATLPAAPKNIKSGQDLLAAMHARYEKSWYRTVTFQQDSTTHNPDGTSKTEIWYEALLLPGKLRINIGAPDAGSGYLFNDNVLTTFKDGNVTAARPFVHLLLVLGFDVYRQDPQTTIAEVSGQGIDLSKLHEDTWEGKPAYVVGADKGDLKSKQFWVEKDRLLFLRLIEADSRDATKLDDQRFGDYRRVPGGWIAARVDFYQNGVNSFSETYSNIKINVPLDRAFFDPQHFTSH